MKKIGKTEKSNNHRIRFNFPPFFGGGGGRVYSYRSQNTFFFSMSGTVTLLSKYGNASTSWSRKRKCGWVTVAVHIHWLSLLCQQGCEVGMLPSPHEANNVGRLLLCSLVLPVLFTIVSFTKKMTLKHHFPYFDLNYFFVDFIRQEKTRVPILKKCHENAIIACQLLTFHATKSYLC